MFLFNKSYKNCILSSSLQSERLKIIFLHTDVIIFLYAHGVV